MWEALQVNQGVKVKSKRCKNYIPEIGCIACYGNPADTKCKGHLSKENCVYREEVKNESRPKARSKR